MDELNALPYLDSVVRETLRYHTVVPGTVRIATQEDVIPVEKPYEDRFGNIRNTIQ
jgi:cytochrome P450